MSRGLLASPLKFFAGWATLCPPFQGAVVGHPAHRQRRGAMSEGFVRSRL